jgi:hypothetical protein
MLGIHLQEYCDLANNILTTLGPEAKRKRTKRKRKPKAVPQTSVEEE